MMSSARFSLCLTMRQMENTSLDQIYVGIIHWNDVIDHYCKSKK